jgi:hypothetical protein
MIDHAPMIFLAAVVAIALGVTAYITLGSWRLSRTTTRQLPPDVVKKRWLNREARHARHEKEATKRPF